MFKVGDIVKSSGATWSSDHAGKEGIVREIGRAGTIVVELLEPMCDEDGKVWTDVGYKWYLHESEWVLANPKPFTCKSLL